MGFDAGAIIGHVVMDNSQYTKGAGQVMGSNKAMMSSGKALGMGFAAIGVAAAAGIGIAAAKANEFNKEFANVTTLVDSATVNTAKMRDELLRLDSRLGSAKDLTNGLYQALSASVAPAKAVEFVGESAKFAKAALIDANTSVDVLTTVLNAYGMEAENAGHVSDVLFETIKRGKVTGEELAGSLGDVIPVASQLNVPIEEVGAAIAAMTKRGVSAGKATTQLNAIMAAFIKPSSDMKTAMAEANIESVESLFATRGLAGALEFLQEATGGSMEEMGKLVPNQRAIRGALTLSGDAMEELVAITEQMTKASGTTNDAFDKQEITFETLSNTINKIAIRVGDVFLPMIYELVDGINTFVNSEDGFNKIGQALTYVGAGFELVKIVGGELFQQVKDIFSTAIETLKETFGDLQKELGGNISAFDIFAGALKLSVAFVKINIKGISAFILSLKDLVVAIIKTGKTASSFFDFIRGKTTWDEVKKNADSAANAFVNFNQGVFDNTKDLVETVINEFSNIPDETEKLAGKMSDAWEKANNKMLATTTNTMNDIKDQIDETDPTVENVTMTMKERWAEVWKGAMEKAQGFSSKFKPVMDKIADTFSSVMSEAQYVFDGISGLVTGFMENELALIEQHNEQKLEKMQNQKESELETKQEETESKLENLKLQYENELISKEEYELRKNEIEQLSKEQLSLIEKTHDDKIAAQKAQARKKENEQKKKMFIADKAFKIAQVWMDYATAVMGFWAAYGGIPFAGPIIAGIMTGVATGIAIAQTVLIAQQQFIPAMAAGGIVGQGVPSGSSMILQNEKGGELAIHPNGTMIVPNDISRSIASSAGKTNKINNNFNIGSVRNESDVNKLANKVSMILGRQLRTA